LSRLAHPQLSSGNGQLNPHHNNSGDVIPILATAVPAVASGTLDTNGSCVIWQLKKDVVWHDRRPFTAADAIFTWEYDNRN
jgi:peptide/nickel transport system substrate-binding protein